MSLGQTPSVAADPSRPSTRARPVALVLPGVGSTADFAERCFGPALREAGYDVVAREPRGHAGRPVARRLSEHSLETHLADVHSAIEVSGARLVAGISLGAEIAVRYAAEATGLDGVLACLPGAAGPRSAQAAVNRSIADALDARGVAAVLDDMRRDKTALRWVVDEVGASWPAHDPASLVAALRSVAELPAIEVDTARRVDVPVGVVALSDDFAHPLTLAQRLVGMLPRAALQTLSLVDVGADRTRLGRAAVAALVTASR